MDIPLEQEPEQPAEQATPVTPPDPAVLPETDADLDAHVMEVPPTAAAPKLEKVVPLGAVQQERAARRTLAATVKEQKAQIEQMQAQMQQVAPILQRLNERRDIWNQLQGQPAQPEPVVDPDVKDYAETHGLYNQQGELDLVRAQKALEIEDRRRAKAMQQEVAPIRQSAAVQQAQSIKQQMYAAKDDKGRPFASQKAIDQLVNNIPPEVLAQPGVPQWVLYTARGLDPSVVAAPDMPEPLFSETPGGRRPNAPNLTTIESHAMKNAGVTNQKTWQQLSATDDLTLE